MPAQRWENRRSLSLSFSRRILRTCTLLDGRSFSFLPGDFNIHGAAIITFSVAKQRSQRGVGGWHGVGGVALTVCFRVCVSSSKGATRR